MKRHNVQRLERIVGRYQRRMSEARGPDAEPLVTGFQRLVAEVIRPLMEETATTLRAAGCEPRIDVSGTEDRPAISLHLGLAPRPHHRDRVVFEVIQRGGGPEEILAYLEARPPPFDIERWARASDVSPARVEQLIVDAVEHLVACHRPE